MNMTKMALISSALLITTPLFAETTTQTTPSYGDNPNLLKVLAVKTQEKVQSTAEKVGAATERGIAKIKPTIDNTWNGTKEYTTEQAVIARDNTREGIDVAVKKVKQTKENIVGSSTPNNVPIERGSLSQQTNTVQQSNNVQQATTTQQAAPQYITPAVAPEAPTPTPTPTPTLNQNTATVEPEIQRQSLPTQNSPSTNSSSQNNTSNDDSDAGVPR
ncbi:hypothetical protein [Acinetobacter lanii]|uniref:Uncharacterized protein n=1 Tax=Acinetobacter lanii TaxID=2715163 RepID=A0A6G8S730_9GAMM|nr:hypothetical protein [Acinetobacter lanii]QIO09930.1 hypothetical protein G8D99_13510 [Acinetobacter lanii]